MADVPNDRIAPGSWILEQLTQILPDVEMSAGRRAWREAQAAWPGQESRLWWKWTAEASESIGLATKTIDCTAAEAIQLLESGSRLITWKEQEIDGPGEWLLLHRSGRSCQVAQADTTSELNTKSVRKARKILKHYESDGRIRCVVIRHNASSTEPEERGMLPFSRAWSLMKPEWPDIWIVLVFAFVVGLLTLATPIAVESLVNTVAFGRVLQPVVVLAIILLTFLTFSAAMRALQSYVVELVQRRLFVRVAGDLAYRLPRAKTEDVDAHYLPELTNRFFDVVTVQKVTAQLMIDGIGLVLTATIGMAVLAFYHPWLLGFDLVMLASIAFLIVVLGRGAVRSAVKESKHKYFMASWLEDIAACPIVFRTSGGTALALERADRLVHEYLEARQKHFSILMRQILFALGLQAAASTGLLGIGGWLVISGQLTLGQLVAAELIVTMIVGALAKLGKHMESFYDLLASVDKLGALFDIPTEHHDGIMNIASDGPIQVAAFDLQYGSRARQPTCFVVERGDSCALFGASGSGKSTVLDMIYGLRTPTNGHVTIEDFDPQDLRPDILRSYVTLVRGAEIFHGTLEENVHLHRPDVTSADVRHALEAVGLYDRVLQLPDGFDTRLHGDGVPLSSSQQNLLCLARAIAGRPRLLMIDGILDGLSDEELETAKSVLLDEERTWTLLIATGRKAIADACAHTVDMKYPGGQSTNLARPAGISYTAKQTDAT